LTLKRMTPSAGASVELADFKRAEAIDLLDPFGQ
jgi:hypothetical protein